MSRRRSFLFGKGGLPDGWFSAYDVPKGIYIAVFKKGIKQDINAYYLIETRVWVNSIKDTYTIDGICCVNGENKIVIWDSAAFMGEFVWSSTTGSIAGVSYITNAVLAEQDFDGYNKTKAILAAISTSTACNMCYGCTFNSGWRAHLGALGENLLIQSFFSAINEAFSLIGYTGISSKTIWSCTVRSSTTAYRSSFAPSVNYGVGYRTSDARGLIPIMNLKNWL